MKINQGICITGKRTVLVPYRKEHVTKYHGWMQSEELQELTASEPLTLEEEYAMQRSWCEDEQKCTFIILDAGKFKNNKENEIESMVGDVNLFFNDIDDKQSAEVEIMVAEKESQGKGLGKEALLSMMHYGVTCLSVKRFTAKIGYTNTRSLQMFRKLSFTEFCRSDVFQEVTLELKVTDEVSVSLKKDTLHLQIENYKP